MRSIMRALAKYQGLWIRRWKEFRAARFWGRQHSVLRDTHAFWLGLDEIMAWVNLKVSGQPQIWPLSWFLLWLSPDQLPVRHALSLGCGTGSLEREVIRHGAAMKVTGVDISPKSLEIAQSLAQDAGYEDQLAYRLSDVESWLSRGETQPTDLVFFHASLHHIRALERVLEKCAEMLKPGHPGLLYLDEYIGPSRHEWKASHLHHAASLFERIPPELRQTKTLRPPVAFDDPTEMIRSSEIESILREYFEIIEYRPYYGNVVMPLVCGIRPQALNDPRVRATLREAMQLEDDLSQMQLIEPLYAVFVGRPRGAT